VCLVREGEDARQDQHRAPQRLSKFLLRHGRRYRGREEELDAEVHDLDQEAGSFFDQPALEATLLDYVHEVDPMDERIQRLEKAISEAIQKA
jgi:hypothetical protein